MIGTGEPGLERLQGGVPRPPRGPASDPLRGKRLLFVVNNPDFFLSHRRELGKEAAALGMEVHVATPATPGWREVIAEGFYFHPVPMTRSRGLPWQEALTLVSLARLYRRLAPDIIHHVTIKPVLYGSLASRVVPGAGVINAISGLGTIFIAKGIRGRLRRAAVEAIYRIAFGRSRHRAIFQNGDDMAAFDGSGILRRGDGVIIKGSGVDPERFRPLPEPAGLPVVALASRMLWDKGVGEFVTAAKALRSKGVAARWVLVGDTDAGNPTAVPTRRLEEWAGEGAVEWWGHRKDMAEVFSRCHVICLPSYREGLPKVLIEAAACGLPIVATDVPGCREIVVHGRNGLLVPARDASGLAEAIESLILDAPLRRKMGGEGRTLFDQGFSLRHVVGRTMELYREVLSLPPAGA